MNTLNSELLIPQHIAFACDGNGRWAQERGLERLEGHQAGANNFHRVADLLIKYNIPITTFWTMSNENWGRPQKEVRGLVDILRKGLDRDSIELFHKGVRLRHIGSLERLSLYLQRKVWDIIRSTSPNNRLTINIAFDYGGKQDILQAAQKIVSENIRPEDVTEDLISRYLYTKGLPDPDLLVRTGGDRRMSNYLIWQTVGAPYFVTPVYWPDFGEKEFVEALKFYTQVKIERNSQMFLVRNDLKDTKS